MTSKFVLHSHLVISSNYSVNITVVQYNMLVKYVPLYM